MRPKQRILEFIQKAYEENESSETEALSQEDRLSVQELFDGMSTGTARIIIEEEMDARTGEEYSIDPLENRGRYYVARIVRPDGSAIKRLLVDKQTGEVQFAGR